MRAILSRNWFGVGASLVVLVLAGCMVWGLVAGWEATAWGALAALFAGLITFGAVAVALREATQGRRDRLVDYELARRRECIKALGDFWGGVMQVGLEVQTFEFFIDELPDTRFDPRLPQGVRGPQVLNSASIADELAQLLHRLLDRWVTAVEPHVFVAHSLLDDTPLKKHINDVQTDFKAIHSELLPAAARIVLSGRKPDVATFHNAWTSLVSRRQGHLDLAREHFGLAIHEVEQAALGHLGRGVNPQAGRSAPPKVPESSGASVA